ncbi:conserved Plasmodium protein, unknown function [Plasmodium knowlesi strain H]|uniref:Uncharacterized protein n=3 Tax=Plasmodium knowlesi TaxID=5850 RepID=A0A5K1VST0_PLAKH|nr:conserved Plasmodium protein, unknown function [Plasmodium knowlesi strain H]OTN66986.1 Uncharacterized protein PKNOH_S07443800 [Plasmodium knowlesi]CAA9988565.1 conserved Plasmodium protein, unknown function [Plasmodium knowlesi strain H]SBO21363.1 conserved Plasmodium protein, unknown function [Plasmodium knowlesi strain H]SBO21819.1 conserved Plasmodium protein, unknown function [Plasmodium knowlesi strain H]VVS78039.1 conserved Plasmodium protein, unknown function [Plasmodium knowlesi s|eukprot:XP_002259541.1 hypothetical protein, conserved in Plasmodium species [Plasmodium knowlesi strain H]
MSFQNYCPCVYPKERNISGLDYRFDVKKKLVKFRRRVFRRLRVKSLKVDLEKIENRKSLLSNYHYKGKKKWYMNFQPLGNVNIEQYWKYDKVTLKDILGSNINTSNDNYNTGLRKSKRYLKRIAKRILRGNPHESLTQSAFKWATYDYNSDEDSANSYINNLGSSLLSLSTLAIKDSEKLLKWKLKYSNNLMKFKKLKAQEAEKNSSTVHSTNVAKREKKSRRSKVSREHRSDMVKNDTVSDKYKIVLKSFNKGDKKGH